MLNCFSSASKQSIPIHCIKKKDFSFWEKEQTDNIKNWLKATSFRVEEGSVSFLPDEKGNLKSILFCVSDNNSFWSVGALPLLLPEGHYHFADANQESYENYALAWGLGAYQFNRYKIPSRSPACLALSSPSWEASLKNTLEGIYLVRDLINTPTEDLGPTEFSIIAENISKKFNAEIQTIVGDDLLQQNYSLIHAVGRASNDAPRLVDIKWGNENHPKITLVGKGVCFDSGGLDIKNSSGMLLMKKDMGGAAHVLGLAHMIMSSQLPVRLRVLIPLVENVISGNAYRPGDVFRSHNGKTVEIGNTDAEGRLILADALAEAVNDKPDLLIDISTLTGAARIALGTDLPALFSNNEKVVHDLLSYSISLSDPMWHMPLFSSYRDALNSYIADISSCSQDGYGGAITAALFLKEFVPDDISWLHFDLMAWNLKARPGRPQGGEAMGLRALYAYLTTHILPL